MADPGNVITLDDRVARVDVAMREIRDVLRRGGVAVIDEFQRLPEVYWSMISNWAGSGVLVADGIVNRVFDRNSPLLGALHTHGGWHNILRGRAEPSRGPASLGAPKGSVGHTVYRQL